MRSSVALGVDISDNTINMALLKQSSKGIELLKTVNGPVPEGAIKNGSIEDPLKLARAIKDLKACNRIRTRRAAVSLSIKPQIVRIIETPKGSPRNIGQFIRNELKSYVVLSGKETAFDFCGLKQGQGSGERLLAVAAGAQGTSELNQMYSRAGLNVEVIEPRLLSYLRVLYTQKVKGKLNCNVLLAILNDNNLTMCVFKKEVPDFVRIENIQNEIAESKEISTWLASQINQMMRFYDIEVKGGSAKWEISIVNDRVKLPIERNEDLKADIRNDTFEIIDTESVCSDILIKNNNNETITSLVPIGLAMSLFETNESGLKINLIPRESSEVKILKKQLVTTAFITVFISTILLLAGNGLSFMAKKTAEYTTKRKQKEISKDTYSLLNEHEYLDRQIKILSERPNQISKILDSQVSVDWAGIMTDIKKRTPKTVRIVKFYNTNTNGFRLEGLSLSYESVRLFVDLLNKSEFIRTASLTETIKNEHTDGLVMYIINCSLAD